MNRRRNSIVLGRWKWYRSWLYTFVRSRKNRKNCFENQQKKYLFFFFFSWFFILRWFQNWCENVCIHFVAICTVSDAIFVCSNFHCAHTRVFRLIFSRRSYERHPWVDKRRDTAHVHKIRQKFLSRYFDACAHVWFTAVATTSDHKMRSISNREMENHERPDKMKSFVAFFFALLVFLFSTANGFCRDTHFVAFEARKREREQLHEPHWPKSIVSILRTFASHVHVDFVVDGSIVRMNVWVCISSTSRVEKNQTLIKVRSEKRPKIAVGWNSNAAFHWRESDRWKRFEVDGKICEKKDRTNERIVDII